MIMKLEIKLLTLSSSITRDLKKVLNFRFVFPEVASGLFLLKKVSYKYSLVGL